MGWKCCSIKSIGSEESCCAPKVPVIFSESGQEIYITAGKSIKVYSLLPALHLKCTVDVGKTITSVIALPAASVAKPAPSSFSEAKRPVIIGTVDGVEYWEICNVNGPVDNPISSHNDTDMTSNETWKLVKAISLGFPIVAMYSSFSRQAGLRIFAMSWYASKQKCASSSAGGESGEKKKWMTKIYQLRLENLGKPILIAKTIGKARITLAADGSNLGYYSGNNLFIWDMLNDPQRENIITLTRPHAVYNALFVPNSDQSLVYSDAKGRIFILLGIKANLSAIVERVLHWHSHAIDCLQFSSDGIHLVSGGKEKVLVSWHINTGDKQFLPRLGSAITDIAVSSDGAYYLVVCSEAASIYLVSSANMTIVASLSGLMAGIGETVLVPLITDKVRGVLVSSSILGQVQYYDPIRQQSITNFDISGQNLVGSHRGRCIVPFKVNKVIVSRDKAWMASYEERRERGCRFAENFIRIWRLPSFERARDYTPQLIYTIEDPFGGDNIVTDMKFQQGPTGIVELLVAVSNQGQLRVWQLDTNYHHHQDGHYPPQLTVSMQFMSKSIKSLDICNDGSVFCTCSGSFITVWNGRTYKPIRNLSCGHADLIEAKFVGRIGEYIVARDGEHLSVWDTLDGKLVWSIIISCQSLVGIDGQDEFFMVNKTKVGQTILGYSCRSPIPTKLIQCSTIGNGEAVVAACLFSDDQLVLLTDKQSLFVTSLIKLQSDVAEAGRYVKKVQMTHNLSIKDQNTVPLIQSALAKLLSSQNTSLVDKKRKKDLSSDPISIKTKRPRAPKLDDLVFSTIPSYLLPPLRMLFWPFIETKLVHKSD